MLCICCGQPHFVSSLRLRVSAVFSQSDRFLKIRTEARLSRMTNTLDLNRRALRNLSPAELFELALAEGDMLTSSGALAAASGACTGRCPKDKRIVDEPASTGDIGWGSVNIKLSPGSFALLREQAADYLAAQQRVYVVDGYAGWDPQHRLKVRVICAPGRITRCSCTTC